MNVLYLEFVKAVLSIFLVVVFLASNVQLHIGTHYCGGHAVKSELMFGSLSLDCGMTEMEKSCESNSKPISVHFTQKDCCQNSYHAIQIDEDFNKRLREYISKKI